MEWQQGTGEPKSACPADSGDDKCYGASGEAQAGHTPPLHHAQQRCVSSSIASVWQLCAAQQQLSGLALHGSESAEQHRARSDASHDDITLAEQQWRLKESMLGNSGDLAHGMLGNSVGDLRSQSPELTHTTSRDVFNKSIINACSSVQSMEEDKSKTFVQKHEDQVKHFGMLRRWDDSQRFLSQNPHLICEAAANYLILWCFRLQQEQKSALMQQVAHQAVALQFILEMGSSAQQDPRACFRHFFNNVKTGQEGYLDVFQGELASFTRRVEQFTMATTMEGEVTMPTKMETPKASELHPPNPPHARLHPKDVLDSLPPELKAGLQLQDMQILQNVLSTMNPQVAEYHVRRCLEAGLWRADPSPSSGVWSAECVSRDPSSAECVASEAEENRMMET
ncbi:hsp90 co-chaperone Cdc37-like 1 isoform X2 [Engraulis encrasicolus]|uniref:hsp90 co-chaperone Cdc37-like 1 isoform X2 n=1 Tax=Engraulis encrasicolus TaxID=184585 RepID=UPI002FD47925